MGFLSNYFGWLDWGHVVVALPTLYFFVGQFQRRRDKSQPQPERDYALPDYKAEDLENILEHIQSSFPSKISGLMLCEFDDGKFDVAVGLEGLPIFVGSDYRKIVKVIDLDNRTERKFIKIVTNSGYFGLVVFDENNNALNGRYRIADSSKLKGENLGVFQVQQDGVWGKVLIDIDEYSFREMPTFTIKEKISIGSNTTPVLLNENEFLGFAGYIVPAKYKTVKENGKTTRKLIQNSYSFGIIADGIFKDGQLNFAFDKASERAI